MISLSRFEANLLQILYAVLGQSSGGQAMNKVYQKCEYAGCLSQPTVEMVQSALAKGMTHWLASRGGWQSQRFMRGDKFAEGAVWQRSSPADLGLTFSAASLRLLVWLTANDPRASKADPWSVVNELTSGDQLLLFRIVEFLKGTEVGDRWFRMRRFAVQPLIAVTYPDQITANTRSVTFDFTDGFVANTLVLECLQPYLASRWIEIEQYKSCITEPAEMQRVGKQQVAILKAILFAAREHARRDLARFVLIALQHLLCSHRGHTVNNSNAGPAPGGGGIDETRGGNEETSPEVLVRRWVRSLRLEGMRLAERTIIYQAASGFLSCAGILRQWTDECRQVGYFDEGYAAAQLWLADWERYDGESSTLRAAAMVRALTV